jgi:tRNA A37 threonylcarbamoyladenosine modification protein TsaB
MLAGEYFQSVKGHTGWLMPRLDSVLRGLGLSPSDIDYVAVGT